jgi:hypothetical protein
VSAPLLAICTACYVGVAVSEARAGHWPMAIVWAGYSLANFGFIWSVVQ